MLIEIEKHKVAICKLGGSRERNEVGGEMAFRQPGKQLACKKKSE